MSSARVALVIGATGAVGSAVSHELAGRGFCVGVLARSQDRLLALQRTLPNTDPSCFWRCLDVRDSHAVSSVFSFLLEHYGPINALVYTPGNPPDIDVPLAQYPLDAWRDTVDTYATGFLHCFQAGIAMFRPRGHFVVISSAITRFRTANLPPFHAGHYAAAKAALDCLCTWARREAQERSIFLSRIAPSALDTPYHQNAPPNRRPKHTIPLPMLAARITDAIECAEELDEVLVAG